MYIHLSCGVVLVLFASTCQAGHFDFDSGDWRGGDAAPAVDASTGLRGAATGSSDNDHGPLGRCCKKDRSCCSNLWDTYCDDLPSCDRNLRGGCRRGCRIGGLFSCQPAYSPSCCAPRLPKIRLPRICLPKIRAPRLVWDSPCDVCGPGYGGIGYGSVGYGGCGCTTGTPTMGDYSAGYGQGVYHYGTPGTGQGNGVAPPSSLPTPADRPDPPGDEQTIRSPRQPDYSPVNRSAPNEPARLPEVDEDAFAPMDEMESAPDLLDDATDAWNEGGDLLEDPLPSGDQLEDESLFDDGDSLLESARRHPTYRPRVFMDRR